MMRLIYGEEDLRYFTGEPLYGFLIFDNGKKFLYTPEKELARRTKIPLWAREDKVNYFFKLLQKKKINCVELDKTKVPQGLLKKFKQYHIKIIDISEKLALMMSKKTNSEISKLQQAAKLADEAIETMRNEIKPGITEQWLSAQGQKYLEKCEAVSFPFMVQFGANTLFTHYPPTQKKLQKNEMIICDIGFKYQGYCSDLTRTFCIKPDAEKQQLYELVKFAQDSAVKKCHKNIRASEIHNVVEKIFRDNEKFEFWNYTLGHGLGLRIHEKPQIFKESNDRLLLNNVFTLEPGLAVPRLGGCRVEDDYVLKNKAISLTKADKSFEV